MWRWWIPALRALQTSVRCDTLPTFDASLIADFGLKVKVETHLWEIFGRSFTVKPYVEFDVDPSRDEAKLQVHGGVAPSVSFSMGRLGTCDASLGDYNVF